MNLIYEDKDIIEEKLYQIIHQFSKSKLRPIIFHTIFLNKTHSFYNEI